MQTTVLVMLLSASLACAAAIYTKKSGIHPAFQWMQTVDIALAAMDFGSDALFIIELFDVGRDPDKQAANTLGWIAFIFLIVVSGVSFVFCLLLMFHYSCRGEEPHDESPESPVPFARFSVRSGNRKKKSDIIDWAKVETHAGWYGLLVVFMSADIELLKLLPWKHETKLFDGFPQMWMAIAVTCVALLEDVPQLICQLVFVSTIAPSYIAAVAMSLTIASMGWRVAKRSLRLMAAEGVKRAQIGFGSGSWRSVPAVDGVPVGLPLTPPVPTESSLRI